MPLQVIGAVDLGYQAVVVRDAVEGLLAEYAQAMLDNSLSMLATIVPADELLATRDTPYGVAGSTS